VNSPAIKYSTPILLSYNLIFHGLASSKTEEHKEVANERRLIDNEYLLVFDDINLISYPLKMLIKIQ